MFERRKAWNAYRKLLKARDDDYTRKKEMLRSPEEFGRWMSDWDADIEDSRDEYMRHRTRYWTRKALGRLVELPDWNFENGYWEQSKLYPDRLLTDKGVFYIRSAVRQEDLSRMEGRYKWSTVASAAVAAVASVATAYFAFCCIRVRDRIVKTFQTSHCTQPVHCSKMLSVCKGQYESLKGRSPE